MPSILIPPVLVVCGNIPIYIYIYILMYHSYILSGICIYIYMYIHETEFLTNSLEVQAFQQNSCQNHPVPFPPRQLTFGDFLPITVRGGFKDSWLEVSPIEIWRSYLEDCPSGCKWLITMAIVSPLTGVVSLPNGLFLAYKLGLLTTYKLGWSSKYTPEN